MLIMMKFTKKQRTTEEIPFIKKSTELVDNKWDYWKITQNRNDYLCVGFTTAFVKRNKAGYGKRYISYKELGKYIPEDIKIKWYNEIKSK